MLSFVIPVLLEREAQTIPFKCHYGDAKRIPLYYFCNTKLCAKHKCEFHSYCWNHVC